MWDSSRRSSDDRGVSSIEWGLVLLLIGILAISAVTFFGGRVGDLWDQAADGSDGQVTVVSTDPGGGTGGGSGGGTVGGGGGGPGGTVVCDPEALFPPEICDATASN